MDRLKNFDIKKIPIKELCRLFYGSIAVFLILFVLEVFHKKTLPIDMYLMQRNKDIFYSALATLGMSVYLRYSSRFQLKSLFYSVLLSMGYGLSGYAMVSNHFPETMLFFTFLPVIFLFTENTGQHKHYIFFSILFAVSLSVDAVDSCILFIYLSVYFLLFSSAGFAERIVDYLHLLLCFLFAFGLSLAFSVPQLITFISDNKATAYGGFYINYDFASFFSRFLTGSAPSEYFSGGRGLDLYFGMFFFIVSMIFFFNNAIERKTRIKEGLFLLFIVGTFQISPLMHLIELCQDTESYIIYYSAFFTFYCIRLAAISICKLPECSKKRVLAGVIAASFCILLALLGAKHNFRMLTVETILCFLVLYILGLVAPLFSRHASTQKLIPYFILFELILNTVIITNKNLVPASLSPDDSFSLSAPVSDSAALQEENADNDSDPELKAFEQFFEEYYATDISDTISFIGNHIEITDADKKKYGKFGTLNSLEEFNIRAHLLGVEQDVFTESDVHFVFEDSENYTVIDEGNRIFCLEQKKQTLDKPHVIVPFSYENANNEHYIIACSFFDFLLEDDGSKDCFNGMLNFVSSRNLSFRFQMTAYRINEDALQQVSDALFTDADPTQQKKEENNLYHYLILLIISACVAILLLHLTIDKDKKKTIEKLWSLKHAAINSGVLSKLRTFILDNKIYLAAFFIPALSFVASMIYYNSSPFGPGSFLDSDGVSSVLAVILNNYYNLKNGNFYISTLGGFINSIYPGLHIIYFLPMLLFSASALPDLFMILDAVLMGAAGFSVCYYLTHRFNGIKANKSDWSLLIPALIYSLNNYIIAMHSYIFLWYLLFALLPILILFQERLIYQKKWFPYSLLLFFCILTNFNIAYYICIFLVMHFFTCKFDSIRDFIKKGFWFAIPSLLGALCNYSNLSGLFASLFTGREGTGYSAADSVTPTFGFFTSYFEQWKQFMMFTEAQPISGNDGHINIYMSILFLLLFVIFFTSKKISRRTKLSYGIMILILFISFNEKITTYVFNGFHYQVGVPNRHVFLFAFLGACMAYESIRTIQELRIRSICIYSAVVIGFICICQYMSGGNTNLAFAASLICIAIYVLAFILCAKCRPFKSHRMAVINILLIFEMFVNLINACSTISIDNLNIMGNYEEQAKAHMEMMKDDNENFYRFSQPAAYGCNNGFITCAPSGTIFTSFLSNTLQYCNYYYGLYYGNNFIMSHHNSTPLAMALSSCKYIEAPVYSTASLKDLYYYDLYAMVNDHFVMKNEDALSLGIFVPDKVEQLPESALDNAASFQNYIVRSITETDADVLTNATNLEIINQADADLDDKTDYIRFKTPDGAYVSAAKAREILYGPDNSIDPVFSSHHLSCEITITPKADGPLYLYAYELVALGEGKAGEKITLEIPYPNKTMSEDCKYTYYTFDNAQYEDFITCAKANQLENVQFKDNVVTAEIDYDNAGYTMFSLPYSSGWKIYIDDKPVKQDDFMDAYMFVQTPAGKHEFKMIYDVSESRKGTIISIAIIITLCIVYAIQNRIEKKGNRQ